MNFRPTFWGVTVKATVKQYMHVRHRNSQAILVGGD